MRRRTRQVYNEAPDAAGLCCFFSFKCAIIPVRGELLVFPRRVAAIGAGLWKGILAACLSKSRRGKVALSGEVANCQAEGRAEKSDIMEKEQEQGQQEREQQEHERQKRQQQEHDHQKRQQQEHDQQKRQQQKEHVEKEHSAEKGGGSKARSGANRKARSGVNRRTRVAEPRSNGRRVRRGRPRSGARAGRNRAVQIALLLFFAFLAVFSGGKAYQIYRSYRVGERAYDQLERVALQGYDMEQRIQGETDAPASSDPFPEVDFEALRQINQEAVAWISCEDTVIQYPVAQAQDNDYYLRHLFDKTYNENGCIFLDCRNSGDFSDPNSILYGHHLRNGNMFALLPEYKDQAYYEEHPTFLLMTPAGNYTVELFSGYVVEAHEDAWQVAFDAQEDYGAWLRERVERSCFTSEVTPEASDRTLTLSTCTYEYDDARFVLHGILVPQPVAQ